MQIDFYQTKINKDYFTNYTMAIKTPRKIFLTIKKKTKRKPYIRATYFRKQKVFLDYFWQHLFDKNPKERTSRLQYFRVALELIKSTRKNPVTEPNRNKSMETLYRFLGRTKDGYVFAVQIKEDKRSGNKHFMSCFPIRM